MVALRMPARRVLIGAMVMGALMLAFLGLVITSTGLAKGVGVLAVTAGVTALGRAIRSVDGVAAVPSQR